MTSPILICGCPGSGTSLVAKILRHAGLFTGADSGPFEARKYHESQCFMNYNIEFLTRTIDFPHAPKSVEQFNRHNSRMQQQLTDLTGLIDRNQLLAEYWGDSGLATSTQAWGWKDPRNSSTAMIWSQVFPQLRVIAVYRKWHWRDRWKSGGSDSGKWFRKQSTRKLRELYQHPIGIDQDSIFQVDVDLLTTDASYLGQVLDWCGLSNSPKNHFDEFLARVGFEG